MERGWKVFCHDRRFDSQHEREEFERTHHGHVASASGGAADFVSEGLARMGRLDALISNDVPAQARRPDSSTSTLLDDFEGLLDALTIEPVRLLRAAIPAMIAFGGGNIALVTSGAPLRSPPLLGRHGYTAARSATNTLARTLAVELAPKGIQVNAVAPFLVYSDTFFPSPIGAEDPAFAPFIEQLVPMGRFGAPEELGSLIATLVSGQMDFVSGQVIAFSGAGC